MFSAGKSFVCLLAAWLLLANVATAQQLTASTQRQQRLNVVLIVVDDLKPELGCFGKSYIHSPSIDRLAATGTMFERAYCQQAVCAPSRASFLTGLRPDTTHIFDLQTPLRKSMPDVVSMPQRFREAGYTTISLGKVYHHPQDDFPQGWSEKPWRPERDFPGHYLPENRKQDELSETQPRARRGTATESPDVLDDAYPDGQITQRATETLQRLTSAPDRPFFLAVGINKPHLPFTAPKKYWDLYDRAKIELPSNRSRPKDGPQIAMTNWAELRQYQDIPGGTTSLSDEKARELIHGYRAAVSFADAQIGKVLDELERLKLSENTVVVLLGDHGWHLGDHGLWCKHTNFEEATHAPLIVRAPGMNGGQRSAALVEFVDIFPTLCDLTGVQPPPNLQGASLRPLLVNPNQPWKRAAFSQYPRAGGCMGHSVTDGRYRFTRWHWTDGSRPDALELYDHQTDPQETVNIAGGEGMKDVVERMAGFLANGPRAGAP
jgi:arylsulfatase A-like enzyme